MITSSVSHGSREAIEFRIESQSFCVEVANVREIRGWTPVTRMPHAPEYVCGVVNLRGTVLPIVDLPQRLGFAASAPSARHAIIVVEVGAQTIGLLVDAVSDIMTIDDSMIQPTPAVASEMAAKFVRGVIPAEGNMISVLNLDALLSDGMSLAA